jgi:hypothetical protein
VILVTGLRLGKREPLPSYWSCGIWVRFEASMELLVVIVSMESADAWHLRVDAMMEDREVEPCGAV